MYDILFLSFFLSFYYCHFFFCVQPHHYKPCNTSNRSHKKCLMVKNRVLEIYSLMAFKRILNNTRIRIYIIYVHNIIIVGHSAAASSEIRRKPRQIMKKNRSPQRLLLICLFTFLFTPLPTTPHHITP